MQFARLFNPFGFASPADERAYAQVNAERFWRHPAWLAAIGLIAFLAYLPFDAASTRQATLTLVRLGFIVPFALAMIGVAMIVRWRDRWPLMLQITFQIGHIGTVALNALMEGTSPYGLSSTSYALNVIVLMVTGTSVFPMPFIHALFACAGVVVSYAVSVALYSSLNSADALGNIFNVGFIGLSCCLVAAYRERLLRQVHVEQTNLRNERNLLSVILSEIVPTAVALSIRQGHKVPPQAFGEVSILFADLVGFTALSSRIGPKHLVEVLDKLFTRFDDIVESRQLEKVKTIGDAYMVVGGARGEHAEVVLDTVQLGFAMIEETHRIAAEYGLPIDVRVGVHIGSVIGGVIGRTRMAFDYWGDAVNIASRLESSGVPGKVQVSEAALLRLRGRVEVEEKRSLEWKGKGAADAFILRAPAPPASAASIEAVVTAALAAGAA